MLKRDFSIALVSVVLSVGISAWVGWWMAPPRVVEFDLKGTVNLFTSQLAEDKDLSPTDAQAVTTAFSGALATSVKEYAKDHHVVVVVSPAIISGARDVTPEIQALTKSNMRSS